MLYFNDRLYLDYTLRSCVWEVAAYHRGFLRLWLISNKMRRKLGHSGTVIRFLEKTRIVRNTISTNMLKYKYIVHWHCAAELDFNSADNKILRASSIRLPHLQSVSLKAIRMLFFHLVLGFSNGSFPHQNSAWNPCFTILDTCPAHRILLDFTTNRWRVKIA
jgi:hypothetical protein